MFNIKQNSGSEELKETGRIEAFSDGVFAVAITLLVHTPVSRALSDKELLTELAKQWTTYLAFISSFATIGVMWTILPDRSQNC